MIARALSIAVLAVVLGGCAGQKHAEDHHDDHGKGMKAHGKAGHGKGRIELSKEALARGMIRVGRVRAERLVGGIDVPAEIRINPDQTAHIMPLTPGRLEKVTAHLGQRVKQGEVLASLRSVGVGEARAQASKAWAAVKAAEVAFERQKKLRAAGIASKRAYDDALAALRKARAELGTRWARVRVLTGGKGSGSDTPIRSPIAGTIIERHATSGEVVDTHRTLFVVADLSRVWVVGQVYEQDVAKVRTGASARVFLHAYEKEPLEGQVEYVASTLNHKTRTLPIRVVLKNPKGVLRPGLFATLSLSPPGAKGRRVAVVPEDAVQRVSGSHVVFVPGHHARTFRAVPIEVGRRIRGWVEVKRGVKAGERVVIQGAFTLKSELLRDQLGGDHHH